MSTPADHDILPHPEGSFEIDSGSELFRVDQDIMDALRVEIGDNRLRFLWDVRLDRISTPLPSPEVKRAFDIGHDIYKGTAEWMDKVELHEIDIIINTVPVPPGYAQNRGASNWHFESVTNSDEDRLHAVVCDTLPPEFLHGTVDNNSLLGTTLLSGSCLGVFDAVDEAMDQGMVYAEPVRELQVVGFNGLTIHRGQVNHTPEAIARTFIGLEQKN